MKLFRWLTKQRGTSALFIDFENLSLSLKDAGENDNPDPAPLLDLTRSHSETGQIAHAQAWADWSHFKRHQKTLKRSGVETVQADTYTLQGKNATDIHMAVSITDLMHRKPDVQTFVLVTGDSDFNPLVELLCRNGKQVIGVGVEGAVSRRFARACDEFHYLSTLPAATGPAKKRAREETPSPEPQTHPSGLEMDASPISSLFGLSEGILIPAKRLKQLLPLASEAWRSVRPQHVSEFRKALELRHQGQIRKQEAALLAQLLKAVGAYGSGNHIGWLEGEPLAGEEGFDMLLASAAALIERQVNSGKHSLVEIVEAMTGERFDPAELRMRAARGRNLLEQRLGEDHEMFSRGIDAHRS